MNSHILPWKDPPFYSWENPLFRLGHFPLQTVSSPEGINDNPMVNWENSEPRKILKFLMARWGAIFSDGKGETSWIDWELFQTLLPSWTWQLLVEIRRLVGSSFLPGLVN